MCARIDPPGFGDLVQDLLTVRQAGITELRRLALPALARAARALGHVDEHVAVEAPAIEHLIRVAAAELGGGQWGTCAAISWGIAEGHRDLSPPALRDQAAREFNLSRSQYRNRWERRFAEQMAEVLLRLAHERQVRLAYLDLERKTPVSTRLAVQWLERFEAMYRIWTPVSGIGNDLTAYRSTLLEPDRPYDEPSAEDSSEPAYTQERQAAGYATSAFAAFAEFHVALKQFVTRFGGLWLLGDAQAGEDAADLVYRIAWHVSPLNDRDESYLREASEQCRGELHPFLTFVASDRIAGSLHDEWQEWAMGCDCSWKLGERLADEHFPTQRNHPGIDPKCQVHQVIRSCNDYMTLIDAEWGRIADWFQIPVTTRPGPTGEELYAEHVTGRRSTRQK